MSHVLDGIPTAFTTDVADDMGEVPNSWECPCGWRSALSIWGHSGDALGTFAALRFHYTHCPMARVTQEEKP